MTKTYDKTREEYLEIDRMINEGLGGGDIYNSFDKKRLRIMPWEVRQILLMVHILLAIIWVGGVLFVGWGVFPAARTLTYKVQREFFHALMKWTHWLFTLAGAGVIATGTLLGTVGGPIKTWDDIWQTTYGHIWATAFIVATFTLLWGITFGYKQSMKVFSEEKRWIWK